MVQGNARAGGKAFHREGRVKAAILGIKIEVFSASIIDRPINGVQSVIWDIKCLTVLEPVGHWVFD